LAPAIKQAINELDRDLAIPEIETMEQSLSESLGTWLFFVRLFGIFAGLAIILAALGLYGVISYSTKERTHEVGVRLALGAERRDVVKLILRQGLRMTLIGLGFGVIASFGLTRLIGSFLYGVSPFDPFTYVAVSLLLMGVGLLAAYVPARRASSLNPARALRYE
jgi:putative ABC transport system permease protein